jgi:hypothetical protein
MRPVEAGSGEKPYRAVIEAGMHAVAVEFDFVQPVGPVRGLVDELDELRLDPFQQGARGGAPSRSICPPFDLEAYRAGYLTPVYFGSTLNNFGVCELLRGITELAPPPPPRLASPAAVRGRSLLTID